MLQRSFWSLAQSSGFGDEILVKKMANSQFNLYIISAMILRELHKNINSVPASNNLLATYTQ